MSTPSTHPVLWGLGGILVSYGVMTSASRGSFALLAGVALLALKTAEVFSMTQR